MRDHDEADLLAGAVEVDVAKALDGRGRDAAAHDLSFDRCVRTGARDDDYTSGSNARAKRSICDPPAVGSIARPSATPLYSIVYTNRLA